MMSIAEDFEKELAHLEANFEAEFMHSGGGDGGGEPQPQMHTSVAEFGDDTARVLAEGDKPTHTEPPTVGELAGPSVAVPPDPQESTFLDDDDGFGDFEVHEPGDDQSDSKEDRVALTGVDYESRLASFSKIATTIDLPPSRGPTRSSRQ